MKDELLWCVILHYLWWAVHDRLIIEVFLDCTPWLFVMDTSCLGSLLPRSRDSPWNKEGTLRHGQHIGLVTAFRDRKGSWHVYNDFTHLISWAAEVGWLGLASRELSKQQWSWFAFCGLLLFPDRASSCFLQSKEMLSVCGLLPQLIQCPGGRWSSLGLDGMRNTCMVPS